jgi:fused signal recognition particle receptor
MRRWFRKKDHQPDDPENGALSPEDEIRETPTPLMEEVPQASQSQTPQIDTAPPPEPEPGEGYPEEIASEAESAAPVPRRGFFRRMYRPEKPLEETELAGEENSPVEEAPPPVPEEPAEWLPATAEEPIIDLVEELPEEEAAVVETRKRRFRRFRERLGRTRKSLAGGLERLFLGRREVDAEVLDELEEILITADLGVDTTLRLVEVIRDKVKRRELRDAERLKEALKEEMVQILSGPPPPRHTARPWVILMVGVNGVGKTTTIAKLAHQDRTRGLNPLLIAADTFRAAAVEQLEIWGKRVGAQVVKQKTGADPAAVVFDGLDAAQARGVDTVYVDTAGRLHTKVNLMEELKKIHRTATKKMPGAPHEILLILDATTGQNALNQARLFHEAVGVTGIILTKLDGTAKGGMALAVAHETGLPLRYIGVGEGMDDLQPFDPEAFVAAILD